MRSQKLFFNVLTLSIFVTPNWSNAQPPVMDPSILTQQKTLGDCQACKLFLDSFNSGLERTARGKFEGGDAAWEEEKLKTSYKRSEMRLIDIQESICKEVTKYEVQCQMMAEKAEEFIEKWWFNPEELDLFSHICIDSLQVCCPPHHYGKDCTPCPGNHENLCSGHGKCRGDGTRKGNGTCLCDPGYEGVDCDQCMVGYYVSHKDDKIECLRCDRSCMGGCRAGTQKDCITCKPGYVFDSERGCLDINECDDISRCRREEFCLNSIGSYVCMQCDKSCDGCHGSGPDMCRKCAPGYAKHGDICIYSKQYDEESEIMTTTRNEEL